MNEHVATYIYDENQPYGVYDIYACYESKRDHDNRNVSFYDIYDKNGECVNEGNPFYTFPKWDEIFQKYYHPNVF
jgi:hypothetical protein